MSDPKARVTQDPANPVGPEILATAIVRVSQAMESLKKSGLNERAIVVLIQDHINRQVSRRDMVSKHTVQLVLNALGDLKEAYVRK